MRTLLRLARALAWLTAVLLIAVGVGGVATAATPVPDEQHRPELYARAEAALAPGLAAITIDLEALQVQAERLATTSRRALVDLAARDAEAVSGDLDAGDAIVLEVGTLATRVDAALRRLPYGVASDRLGPRMQARLVAVVDAVDAVRPLAGDWGRLSGAAVPAISITSHLEQHDVTAFEATQEGAAGRYAAALERLTGATAELDAAQVIRDRLAQSVDTSTLDAWIERNRTYDAALVRLYTALEVSPDNATPEILAAFAEVEAAQKLLPPDTRALIVIIGDLAQGGLNQAAIAVEEARGALTAAVAAVH
ncbi:MAG: hypothetical protein XU10_C0004G0008 [Chloroflexi bacterium CSP1-4]|nr:MAG: hypothetical protein XU10_C0004G0008 [Chloroflexi bacterium CSP1-4]